MIVKFLKDTKACVGGADIRDFKKDDVIDASDKLGKLLIAGKQAEKSTAKPTIDLTAKEEGE